MVLTGNGPLWSRISRTAKSDKPSLEAAILCASTCARARWAFIRINQRWAPEVSLEPASESLTSLSLYQDVRSATGKKLSVVSGSCQWGTGAVVSVGREHEYEGRF